MKIRQFETVGILLMLVATFSDAGSMPRVMFGIGLGLSFQLAFRFIDYMAQSFKQALAEGSETQEEKTE